jgi:hypothetical protein
VLHRFAHAEIARRGYFRSGYLASPFDFGHLTSDFGPYFTTINFLVKLIAAPLSETASRRQK